MTLLIDAASTPADPTTGQRPVAPGYEVAANRRGRTTIATSVIAAIVGRVAIETPGVSAATLTGVRGWFGAGRPDHAASHVDETGEGLNVALEVAVTYPHPIAPVVDHVRARIIDAVDRQFAMTVERVDVTVTELRRETRSRVTARARAQ